MLCSDRESNRDVSRTLSPREDCYDSSNDEESEHVVGDGRAIMESVPFHSWCVTRSDLKKIRRDIRQAIEDRVIVPNEMDDFEPEDDEVGPSVYTVVQHFIKPVTHEAGDMSFAIMMNREGMECDLFVTHAWQEGIFEFIDKVLNSWPGSATCAYCCMLSNPQNLNINEMIKNPRESPFAQALHKATYVIVIPNRKGSIYSRLWCVYEIYLATKFGKQIYIATRDIRYRYLRALVHLFVIAAVAAVLFPLLEMFFTDKIATDPNLQGLHDFAKRINSPKHIREDKTLTWVDRLLLFFVEVAALSSVVLVFSGNTVAQRVANSVGIFALVGYFTTEPPPFWSENFWEINSMESLTNLAFTCILVILVPFFILSEYDRILEVELQYEENELVRHYTGSVLHAECFSQEDKNSIFADIGDAFEEVDGAVHTLIMSGMSTPSLRAAASRGVDVHGAGHTKVASVVVQWLAWLLVAISTLIDIEEDTSEAMSADMQLMNTSSPQPDFFWRFKKWNAWTRIIIVLLYVCVIPFKNQDGQIFVCRCIVSWSHIIFVVFIPVYTLTQNRRRLGASFQALATLYELCVLGFCIAGLANVTNIPFVGPCLAQFTLWSFSCCCSCFRKKKKGAHERGSNSEDSASRSSSDRDEHLGDTLKFLFKNRR